MLIMKTENSLSNTSISDENNFKNICKSACEDKNIFNSFKSNPLFTQILEHTTYEQGVGYVKEIENLTKIDISLIEKFKTNDIQGNPQKYWYKEPYGNISPSTLRYIKVLNDLITLFGNLDDMSIVEIGVGYGGQSKIIQDHFKIKEYNFVDLPEVLGLTKKYLDMYDYKNLNFLDFNNLPDKKYDLIISNYAITECSKEMQDIYLEKIIYNSNRCYITGNDIGEHFNLKNYNKDEWGKKIPNSIFTEEKPLTHHKNYILYF